MNTKQMLEHEQERRQKSFKKAEEIVKSWPKWKREYKLTKYCAAELGKRNDTKRGNGDG